MNVEVIAIGTELLNGQTTNTNAAFIGKKLTTIGLEVTGTSCVGDQENAIKRILREVMKRSDLIIITGGLGPTDDDITRKVIADFLHMKLVLRIRALRLITEKFLRRRSVMPEASKIQAYLPQGARLVPNEVGLAPGFICDTENKTTIALPGVPREMEVMFVKYVVPFIHKKINQKHLTQRTIRLIGVGETRINHYLKSLDISRKLTIAYLPQISGVDIRLSVKEASNVTELNKIISKLKHTFSTHVYGYNDDTIENVIARKLFRLNKTFSVAESCTGGAVGDCFTNISGISRVFKGGVIAYSNDVKVSILKVSKSMLKKYGAVSEQIARAMARGVRRLSDSELGIATTGIAGPTGGSKAKPVGMVCIAISDKNGDEISNTYLLSGDRQTNKAKFVQMALFELKTHLTSAYS